MAIARPVDRRLFFLFDRAHTQLAKAAEQHLSHHSKVTTAQASVLIYLGYHDHCSLTELAEGTGRNNPAITGLVARMETIGLVTRIDDAYDRRSKRVMLTHAGWERRELVMDDFRDFNTRLIKGLSDQEVDAVLKFLSNAHKNVV